MFFIQKITDWYFTRQALPYWCILFLDCIIVFISGCLSVYLGSRMMLEMSHLALLISVAVCCMPFFIISFRVFHTYDGVIRYSSYYDLFLIAKATLLGSLLTAIFNYTLYNIIASTYIHPFGFRPCVILFGISTLVLWLVRLLVKGSFESFNTESAIPVAIYGTQEGGIALANSIMSVHDKKYSLHAFISDDENMNKKVLMGRHVYFNDENIVNVLTKLNIRAVLVSPLKSEKFRNNQQLVDNLTNASINIMMMPAEEEWDGKSELTFHRLHEVEIEDLLPRDEIKVDMDAIGAMLTGKCILITGAAGSIGSEMVRQVARYNPSELILVDQAETPMHDIRLMMANKFAGIKNETIVVSITDKVQMESIFSQYHPEYVFHAAAYKHVPMMEDNPAQAVRNNINGTRIIADLAVKYGTKKFVMISTDKAVNPTNVMGCSKRICEIYCQSLNKAIVDGKVNGVTQFVTTRFGNVLGSNGSVIPIFKDQIKKGGPITVTHPDIIRFFMLIPEACKLVLEAGTMGKGGEIFVFDMGKPVKIVDLAKRMIKLSGAQNIEIKFVGLRDGEKLYEEVLNDKEQTIPTVHPKIMVAKVREYEYEVAKANEDSLLQISYSQDAIEIVKKMKEIVPEYNSKNKRYENLK